MGRMGTWEVRRAGLWITFLICAGCSGLAIAQSLGVAESSAPLRVLAERRGIRISTAVDPRYLAEAPYSEILASEFNGLEPQNAMKFAPIHPRPDSDPNSFDFAAADQLVAFAKEHDMAVRGHTLVWHRQIPEWVTKGNYSPERLRGILQNHIAKVIGHFGDSA